MKDKQELVGVGISDLQRLLLGSVHIIDIREVDEVEMGWLPSALAISPEKLKIWITNQEISSDACIVIYCATGKRSVQAALDLRDAGYRKTFSLKGGIHEWLAKGQPVEGITELELASRQRFSRQMLLPGFGVQGQARLAEARVLVVGAGGLGSPCLYYLAAAGVGMLGVVDPDVVDVSNLHRQILYTVDDIGRPKVQAAHSRLSLVSPDLVMEIHHHALSRHNALQIMRGYDLVIDCTDNFASRYALNDAALEVGIPLIHGAIIRYEGSLGIFNLDGGPCYRCVYPDAPPSHLSPACVEAGVLGVVPGMIGVMQANEALKIILGLQPKGHAQLIRLDALTMSMQPLGIAVREGCHCRSFNRDCRHD